MLAGATIAGLLVGGSPPAAEGPDKPPEPAPETQPASGEAPGLGFSPDAAPQLDNPASDLGLTRQDDGGYLYVDPAKRFTAKFEADGTVQFADRWKRPDRSKGQRGKCCALPAEGFAAINPLMGMPMSGPIEWMMAIQGHDPHSIAKNAILEQTLDLRIRLAVAYTVQLLDQRLRELSPELLALWSDTSLPAARKRELLFERWDECDERFSVQPGDVPADAVSEIDGIRVETAERARRKIEAFVRRHAPKGTRNGYQKHELDTFNRRRVSHERFSPYTPRKR
jgi:hypothetical protein